MRGIQEFASRRLTTILLLLLAGGFAMVVAELVMTDHLDGIQLVGPIAAAVGALAVLVGLFARGALRSAMVVLLLLLSITGLVGTWEHYESRNEGAERGEAVLPGATYQPVSFETAQPQLTLQQEDEEGENEGRGGESEGAPPPLSPLAITGLALMGALVLLARRDDNSQ